MSSPNATEKRRKKMYLFVWTDVLNNYTSGMAFAIAPDLETALTILNKKAGYALDLPIDRMQKLQVNESCGFYVYGGG